MAVPYQAEAAFLGPTSRLTRRVEIYEADATTRWLNGENDNRLIQGSVTVDYSRDERRSFDLSLDNSDKTISHDPSGLWYDKVLKIYSGVRYIDTTPVITYSTRKNRLINPTFKQAGSTTTEVWRNLHPNPSFEANQTTYNTYNGAVLTRTASGTAFRGGYVGRLARTTAGNGLILMPYPVPWGPSKIASARIRIRKVSMASTGSTVTLSLQSYNNGAGVGSLTGGTAVVPALSTSWQEYSISGATTSGDATINQLGFMITASGTAWSASDIIEVDGCEFYESAGLPKGYIDGDEPSDDAGWTHAWIGTAHASESVQMAQTTGQGNLLRYASTLGGGTVNQSYRVVQKTAGPPSLWAFQSDASSTASPGEFVAGRLQVRQVGGTANINVSPRIGAYGASFINYVSPTPSVILPPGGTWVDVDLPSAIACPAGTISTRMMLYSNGSSSAGTVIEWRKVIQDKVSGVGQSCGWYFDGFTDDFANRTYSWDGAIEGSMSTEITEIETPAAVEATWETQIGEFVIDSISEDHFPNVIKVNGRDYTKKCLTSKFVVATAYDSGTPIENAIRAIAQAAGISKFILPLTGKTLAKQYVFERGMERWNAMKEIAGAYGYELFFDPSGYLVMREFLDPVTAPLAYTLDTGQYGNLVSYTKSVNDTRIYNHIVVTGESAEESIPPVWATAKNEEPSSPTRIAKLGDRVYQYTSSFITTTAQAQDVANKFLKIHALEEFDLSFASIALPWLEVGEIVEFIDPDPSEGQPTRFLMTNLTLPLGIGAMSGNAKRVSVVG